MINTICLFIHAMFRLLCRCRLWHVKMLYNVSMECDSESGDGGSVRLLLLPLLLLMLLYRYNININGNIINIIISIIFHY
ncbi:hypothetical protein PPL_01334 [Heterostelium album PN500]|uniref:Uncharacterized protein n=1 Tax=Heterostelium pallidum (strain ATCC 26659 / Pp 5 / PN500) TaxID=670386 RepID=D3AYS0_HETP5|nr:hypothetical protein PPL_01334 [Heterostelium album PN500]EFA86097.1 hypothetical protein PPL_01334 [Heterostelium album PN500]|eukprot:XP_020438203.1 hypothetical protein PPL_01334 [Heterostelium album PN500]